MDSDQTSREVVQTYVPAYQKEHWQEHAERLDMSLSEFVRTMVQAGRRGFLDTMNEDTFDENSTDAETPVGSGSNDDLESAVIQALSEAEYLSWDDLVDVIVGDVEDQIERTLQELQAENRVQYSGRHGGYTLDE